MITAQRISKFVGKQATRALIALRTAGGAQPRFHCPACDGDVVDFFRYGENGRWGCPACNASPRERLVNHLLDKGRLSLPTEGAILHVAPGEGSLIRRFSTNAGGYLPADLDPDRYPVANMRRTDLMEPGLSNGLQGDLGLFYASHVLEHVPDDALVLRNIYAALRPGGEAWLIVPLWNKPTEDGADDLSGRERERRFGQWDHVRQYGLDFADRIRAAGFSVELMAAKDCAPADVARFALDDIIFVARKG